MATLKDIRKRIRAVKSTRQITRAMKMVAAARLRRAQESIEAMRPYAYRLRETIWEISRSADVDDHPLLANREPKRVMLLVLTSDRGLCGGFNSQLNRETEKYIREHMNDHEDIGLTVVGRKGRDYFKRRPYRIEKIHTEVLGAVSIAKADEIGREIITSYQDAGLDAVFMVYNEFKNAVSQKVQVERLLPVIPEETADTSEQGIEFIYEPSKTEVLDAVLPLYVNIQIYRAMLESVASEMGARMTAMDSATKNAGELIRKLTLTYNRVRQAAITKELMEIVAGAESLKG